MQIQILATIQRTPWTRPLGKALAFIAGLALSFVSYAVYAAQVRGDDTVQGLYEAMASTMKNGRTLGPGDRQLEPDIRRSFDVTATARLSVGPAWAGRNELQRSQLTDSFERYISAIYADRFDSYTMPERDSKYSVSSPLPRRPS